MFESYPDVVTVAEIQKMLRISRSSVMKLIQSGAIDHRVVGRRILISKSSVIAYFENK